MPGWHHGAGGGAAARGLGPRVPAGAGPALPRGRGERGLGLRGRGRRDLLHPPERRVHRQGRPQVSCFHNNRKRNNRNLLLHCQNWITLRRDDTEFFTESEGEYLDRHEDGDTGGDLTCVEEEQTDLEDGESEHYKTPGIPRPVIR